MVNTLMRWNPFSEIRRLQDEMNRLFDTSFGEQEIGAVGWVPPVDIEETADGIRVTAEVPGMKKEDIRVEFENGLLTIRGERTRETKTEEKNFHRVERSYGTFVRTFRLPASVNAEKIAASYADGVLTLEVPKTEAAKARRIEIAEEKKAIEAETSKK
jgi:HSP20 family protein